MKLSVVCCLVLASFVANATCFKNSEFFEEIKDLGDVEDLESPLDVSNEEGETVVLNGDPDDELDEDLLAHALALKKNDEVSIREVSQKPWWHHHVHHHYHIHIHHRRYARKLLNGLSKASNNRCIRKSIVLNLDQPKKFTQTYCLTTIQLSNSVYRVKLIQDENVVFDNKVLMMGPSKEVCAPFSSAPERNACMKFRLEGSSFCASVAADLWADHKMNVDFGCTVMVQKTEEQ